MQGRLQPATGPHLALIAQPVRITPAAALRQKAHGFFDMPLIGIAFLNDRHRNAVRAENNFRARSGTGKRDRASFTFSTTASRYSGLR